MKNYKRLKRLKKSKIKKKNLFSVSVRPLVSRDISIKIILKI